MVHFKAEMAHINENMVKINSYVKIKLLWPPELELSKNVVPKFAKNQ